MTDFLTSNVQTTAGTKFFVSEDKPTDNTESGYEAVTWEEIGEVVDGGDIGRVYEWVTHSAIGRRGVIRRKGTFDDGAPTWQLGKDATDDGQKIMLEARDSDDSYAFKIELQDGTTFLFMAQVGSYNTNLGTANSIVGATAELGIDAGTIIEVEPD